MINSENLPLYTLPVTSGQYPFKNAHIAKIFDIHVVEEIQSYSQNPIFHKFLEAYHEIKSPLLINILRVEKTEADRIRISYEYVETPLSHYIRRYLHDNLQIKIEMLMIAIREVAYKFVTKKINVIDALNVVNLGVRMTDAYRQSMFVGKFHPAGKNPKQILMPDFKLYIDLHKCKAIGSLDEMGRLVIETDKKIYAQFRREVDLLIESSLDQQIANRKKSVSEFNCLNRHFFSDKKPTLEGQQQEIQKKQEVRSQILQFTEKKKKRKRENQPKKINPFLSASVEEASLSKNVQNTSDKNVSKLYESHCYDIKEKVSMAVERSRKNLEQFKKKYVKIEQ